MAGDTTEEVSELYQEYPYPAHGVISRVVATLVEDSVRDLQRELGRRRLRLLDAGCGTGEQTTGVARAFPELEVVGIDLNPASLEMATRLAERAAIPVRFERRNLMQPLDDLGQFDVVVSVGVLHSLADPKTGFQQLRRIIAPHGTFMGMVYGAFGKWETFQIRDAIEQLCGSGVKRRERLEILASSRLANNTGLLHYLEMLLTRRKLGPRTPLIEAVRRVLGGRNAAYQADTFTHVQEVVYTWQELANVLEETGWTFEGWPRKSGMPDRPGQLFQGQALEMMRQKTLLEQAAIYERLVRPVNLYFLASPDPAKAPAAPDGRRPALA